MKISVNQYARTLLEVTDGKTKPEVSTAVKRFATILKKDWQMKNISKIIEKFSQIYNVRHGIIEAEIISREKLNNKLCDQLQNFLRKKYSAKEVRINNIVDKKIKGGVIIKVGDEVLDGSVAAQLKKVGRALSN